MFWRRRGTWLALLIFGGCASAPTPPPAPPAAPPTTLQVGETTVLAVSPPAQPCCEKPTLLDFLGVVQVCEGATGFAQRIGSRLRNRLGMIFPGLEATPPLLAITDPANLAEDSPPAVKAAAEVKAEEDAAEQKIKALRYLATIGCGGCYPTVEDALLAALDDCTEEVRYEATLAIRGTAGNECQYCNSEACCSEKVQNRLYELANEQDSAGCYVEPSQRVRRTARLALAGCGPVATPSLDAPLEGPNEELQAIPPPAEAPVAQSAPPSANSVQPATFVSSTLSHKPRGSDDLVVARVNGIPIWSGAVLERMGSQHRSSGLSQFSDGSNLLQSEEFLVELDNVMNAELMRQADEEWSRKQITGINISQQQKRNYYQSHLAELRRPAEIRWEVATVSRSLVESSLEAELYLAYFRSRALGQRAPVPAGFSPEWVAIATFTWTAVPNLPANLVGDTLRKLREGQLSEIVEDEAGWHVVRVLERRAPKAPPFEEVQGEIHRRLVAERSNQMKNEFREEYRNRAVIWTIAESAASATARIARTAKESPPLQ